MSIVKSYASIYLFVITSNQVGFLLHVFSCRMRDITLRPVRHPAPRIELPQRSFFSEYLAFLLAIPIFAAPNLTEWQRPADRTDAPSSIFHW
jgi:hypothetical protein